MQNSSLHNTLNIREAILYFTCKMFWILWFKIFILIVSTSSAACQIMAVLPPPKPPTTKVLYCKVVDQLIWLIFATHIQYFKITLITLEPSFDHLFATYSYMSYRRVGEFLMNTNSCLSYSPKLGVLYSFDMFLFTVCAIHFENFAQSLKTVKSWSW